MAGVGKSDASGMVDSSNGASAGISGKFSIGVALGLSEIEGLEMLGLFRGDRNGDVGTASVYFLSELPGMEASEVLVLLRGNPKGDSGVMSLLGLEGSDGPETPGFLTSPSGGVRIKPTGVTSLKLFTRPISILPRDWRSLAQLGCDDGLAV